MSTEKSACGGDGGCESNLIGLGPVGTFLRTEKSLGGGESDLIGLGPVGTFLRTEQGRLQKFGAPVRNA
jgi:hypothetical protein